jgi:peptide/nickel transport system permease protein
MGINLFAAFLVVVANLVVDLIYFWLDPRIRLGGN